jgi:hypothetical protein
MYVSNSTKIRSSKCHAIALNRVDPEKNARN